MKIIAAVDPTRPELRERRKSIKNNFLIKIIYMRARGPKKKINVKEHLPDEVILKGEYKPGQNVLSLPACLPDCAGSPARALIKVHSPDGR